LLAQPVPPEFLEIVVRESLKLPARVWRAALLEGLLEADFSEELAKIQVPTLIFWGDQGLSRKAVSSAAKR
jgi:pimeloyl-ACP methyl ester carboxylesterase